MFDVDIKSTIGQVGVKTTKNTGLSPEYWTDRIMERLVQVSDNADPLVQAQARAFKDNIEKVILLYMRQAIASDRSTVAGLLEKQGHCKMAQIIRRL